MTSEFDLEARQALLLRDLQLSGISADDIKSMPAEMFARMRSRYGLDGQPEPIEAQSATETLPAPTAAPTPAPASPADPTAAPDPFEGLDPDSEAYFHAWRSQRTSGGEGVGIFSGISSRSEEYRAAAARHAGRTAYSQSNVQEPPRIERVFIDQEPRDSRPFSERFSNQASFWRP